MKKTENYNKEKQNKQRKQPLLVKILLLPLKILLLLLIIILVWFTFCFFDRVKPLDLLPPDFSIYIRTDSAWDTAEPLLDLDATLIAMTSPDLQKYRNSFLKIKKSKLRKNPFVRLALKRRFDGAVYAVDAENSGKAGNAVTSGQADKAGKSENSGLLAVMDAGLLSGALRLMPFAIPHIKSISGKVELSSNRHGSFYQLEEKGFFIIKKNLLVFSNKRELLEEAMTYSNSSLYKKEAYEAVTAKLRDPLRILVNGENLLKLTNGSEGEQLPPLVKSYMESMLPYLRGDEFASMSFGITNNELNVSIEVPLAMELSELPEQSLQVSQASQAQQKPASAHPVLSLLQKDSVVPSLLPKFSEDIQYYTLISAGNLKNIKDAAATFFPEEKNFSAVWNKSDTVSRIVFNRGLDELLFSWPGDEFAVFGIEGKAEPVFAVKIADEEKRREIFDRVFSSYLIQTNDSLLVDGVRLPCLQMPGFVLSVLQALNVNVPRPYFLVKDDYLYLSQSPENLAAINYDFQNAKKLSSSQNWMRVSSRQSPYSTLSLYYNLERSVPFFVKGNSAMSKILSLYNSGRFDLRIKDSLLTLQLQASAVKPQSSIQIPGFPMELENKSDALLVQSKAKKSSLVFWVETGLSVNSLDYTNFERNKIELPEVLYIVPADESTIKENGGEIWAVTKSGMVYLLNSKLESVLGYPVLSGLAMTCPPFVYKDSLVLCGNDGRLCFVSHKGEVQNLETGIEGSIKSTPSVSGDILALYEKGFFGGIHIYKISGSGAGHTLESLTAEGPLELDGIAYGSPCLFTAGGKQYAAMITQAGQLYVYDFEGRLLPPFPLMLNDVFYLNVKMADGCLFALSAEGELYRIALDGKILKVKIPYFTAKSGYLTVCDYDGISGQEIFISGEGNSLYGFNSYLELLPGFPLAGYGNPLFEDLNGDNIKDCLVITYDNKLAAAAMQDR